MPILLDIGNTSVTYGFYEGGRLQKAGSAPFNYIPKIIKNWCKNGGYGHQDIVISSVVPKNTLFLKKLLSSIKGLKLWIIGQNLRLKIKHNYLSINKLGCDRIVNIYGAVRMYRPPMLIVDFGTAITFDYISPQKVFKGGMIIPGPEIAFQTLIERAALLPKKIRLPEKSSSFLGTNTYDCMKTGILEGYGAMADGLTAKFKKRFGQNLRVLVTGGFARTLKPYSHSFEIVDPLHSIKSLFLIYKDLIQK